MTSGLSGECPTCGLNQPTPRDIERWRSRIEVPDGALVQRLGDGTLVEASTSLCWNLELEDVERLRCDEEAASAHRLRQELIRLRRRHAAVLCTLAATLTGRR